MEDSSRIVGIAVALLIVFVSLSCVPAVTLWVLYGWAAGAFGWPAMPFWVAFAFAIVIGWLFGRFRVTSKSGK